MQLPPTLFQRQALWTAIAAVSVTTTVAIVIGVIYLGTQIIAFLQPILIPFAVAGVMAYLLEPAVKWLERRKLSRQRAVIVVFTLVSLVLAGVAFLVLPALVRQGTDFIKEVPGYVDRSKAQVTAFTTHLHSRMKHDYGIEILDFFDAPKKVHEGTLAPGAPTSAPTPSPAPPSPTATSTVPPSTAPSPELAPLDAFNFNDLFTGAWVKNTLATVLPKLGGLIQRSVGGFLGVSGFLLSLVIVPLYLYYFLTESAIITQRWSDYLPLRASQFKDEVVDTLTEINRYLIAFFRGQLVVSMINGIGTGIGLVFVGLKFGWLIGLSLCVLGMVPYLGIITCMIPAVLIASVQGGSWLVPASAPGWVFPVVVLGIFVVVQQIDGWFITPKIVGGSVGLHPMTVILSVFVWSLVLGGLLGAILAVPLTAAIKVLFQRYVWNARLREEVSAVSG